MIWGQSYDSAGDALERRESIFERVPRVSCAMRMQANGTLLAASLIRPFNQPGAKFREDKCRHGRAHSLEPLAKLLSEWANIRELQLAVGYSSVYVENRARILSAQVAH